MSRTSLSKKRLKQTKLEQELAKLRTEKTEELEREKAEWASQKLAFIQPDKSDLLELDVGGTQCVTTSRSTLTKYHNSLLAALFAPSQRLPLHNGKVFIDRDNEPFLMMLSFLRNGVVPMFNNKQQEQSFKDELEYWQIPIEQKGPTSVVHDWV
jgi:hypothetical protein